LDSVGIDLTDRPGDPSEKSNNGRMDDQETGEHLRRAGIDLVAREGAGPQQR